MKQNNYLKNIKDAITTMDPELLRDTLAYILKVYVVDKQTSPGGVSPMEQSPVSSQGETSTSFAGIIREMKNRYPFKELNSFSVEGDRVFITIDNARHEITQSTNMGPGSVPELNKKETTGKETMKDNGSIPSGRFEKLELE